MNREAISRQLNLKVNAYISFIASCVIEFYDAETGDKIGCFIIAQFDDLTKGLLIEYIQKLNALVDFKDAKNFANWVFRLAP